MEAKDFPPLPPGQKRAAVTKVVMMLIKSGTLAPGDRLPAENALAAYWGISRRPVREGLEVAQQQGMLLPPTRGTVRTVAQWEVSPAGSSAWEEVTDGRGQFVCHKRRLPGSSWLAVSRDETGAWWWNHNGPRPDDTLAQGPASSAATAMRRADNYIAALLNGKPIPTDEES